MDRRAHHPPRLGAGRPATGWGVSGGAGPAHPTGLTPAPPRHPGADTDVADHTTALAGRITRLEAAAEAGRVQQADAGLVAQMRAQRVRLRPDRDLDQVVLALRTRLSTARMDAMVGPAPPARAAAVAARQEKLRTQAAAAAAAQAAEEVSTQARGVLTAAEMQYLTVAAQRKQTPAVRVLRRRELDGALTEALTRRNDAARVASDARYAAYTAAGRVGAYQGHWQQLVDAAADTPTLTAELAAAEAADAHTRSRDEQGRAQRAERTDLTRRQLTVAENERARRRALTPEVAAAEGRIRRQLREEAPTPLQAPTRSPLRPSAGAALVAEHLAQDLSRGQGHGYGM